MKVNKFMLVSILLLTILFIGAVSAAEEYDTVATNVVADAGDNILASPVIDEINTGGDANSSDSSSADVINQDSIATGVDVNNLENSMERLGASTDADVLGDDYDILTPQNFFEHGFTNTVLAGNYKMVGTFASDEFPNFIFFDEGCIVEASEAEFQDIGIILQGDVQLSGLTLTSSQYLEDDDGISPGAIVYVSGDDNILDGLTINYAPTAEGDAYGVYVHEANNLQLLNSNINFTGSSLEGFYEYAMRMGSSEDVLIQGNTIIANLPILDVDYSKGDPGLATDLVLNTGIITVNNLDIINNTFIANVIDRNGYYSTLDCVMMESCNVVNVVNNKFREEDFITNEGDANYLNVLDMYYSSNVLVQGNYISVETTGGTDNAGTSYPIQLTGPYEGVVIDGNTLYANCGGPALGVYSQNFYGGTEITVQNNNIDITGLPTDHSWGLVSGIELQDNVARVYNNTITTKSVTGSFEDGMNLYGISYAQALMDDHNYDIRENTIETQGKYAIYLLKAQDTTITDNYLVSSSAEGDDAVYIQDASGNTVIENNHGAKKDNVVTQDNFYTFFDDEGNLLDTVEFDELIFKGEFENLVDYITLFSPLTITGDGAVLYNMGFVIDSADYVTLDNLKFVADTPLGTLIDVIDSYYIDLINLDIIYDGGDEEAAAINVASDNVNILNNTIFFESHVSDDSEFAVGLKITGSSDVIVDGNRITTQLPCVYVMTYDEDYYMMGSDRVNPVRLKDCSNLLFTNNFINSTTNDFSAEFPTIQAIQIIGCHDSILDHNNISMIDEMTPAGMDNYLYGINFGYNTNVTFSNNYFNMSTSGSKVAAGTAYAFQGVESEVNIKGNHITSISNGPNLGVYVASMYGGDSDLVIEGNFINVTGYSDASHSWALVSGIEIQNGDAKIYNNTVYTYNKNEYDDAAYMYGISYAQWMYGDRSFDIQDNYVYTEGKYTISIINATSLNVERNTLYAHELTGDDSVDSGSCADVNIENNLPEKETNIVTQDNFFNFFDEYGNLLDSVEYDELIFQGEFSDLASYITIDRALNITGDGAILNDIGFIIAGEGVTLDGMTLVANSNNLGNLIDIAGENAVISNMIITYTVDEAASAIEVRPGANGVQILNNNIYFESTVDDYAVDEVTTAICVNSGVSLLDDEDPIEGLVIDGNNITAVIPAFLADIYENEYYVMGLSAVNGVRINGAEEFRFTNNKLDVTTNRLDRTTPTFQALYVASSSGLIDGNNISMIDTFTPAGKDVYLYAVELISDEELIISNNNFNLSTTGGKDEAGSAYAILAIASEFEVTDNNFTTVSNGPNLAIYFPSRMGSPCDAVISGNFINVTGLATAAHDTGLVSGIEIQTGDVEITDNIIYTYNIGEYAEGNYIYGISYAQDGSTPDVIITDNTIYTEGHYAISFLEVDNAVITDNYLVSTDLVGNAAVEIKDGKDNTVENNTPELPYADIIIDADAVWIGNNATVRVTVPNATGAVTIEVNNKSYGVIDLDGCVASVEIAVEDLVAGKNNITVAYEGPGFKNTTATGALYVLDGVITNETYGDYFDASGNLVSAVPDDVTLDFQGLFLGKFPVYINKAVNVVSTTGDALFDCGDSYAGNAINSFNIVAGGDNTNITGLEFINYCLYIKGASNVTVDDISIVANKRGVGSGTGFLSIHTGAYNTIVKNSYFENGGTGSSLLVLGKGGAYAYFDHNVFNITGSSGNILSANQFVGSGDSPEHVSYTNNVLYNNQPGSSFCYAMTVSGSGNLVENNTIYHNGSGILNQYGATSSGNVYRNNTLYGNTNFNPSANSLVENNKIYATTNIAANTIVSNNTFTTVAISGTGSVFTNNTVSGTVTVKGNDNSIIENNIVVTGDYAVDLGTTTGNTVTDNYLVAALYKGDVAVKFTGSNVVENNTPVASVVVDSEGAWIGNNATVTVTVANTTGTVTISVNGKNQTVELVDGVATVEVSSEDLAVGVNNVTVTYNGPEYAPVTVDGSILVLDGVITNETYKYYFDASGNLVSAVPDDVTLDFQGLFLGKFPVYINKAVNVVSTTGDALFDCGDSYAGNAINSFNIVAGGDNTNITGLEFINYCLYIKGASNVTVDDISIVANKRGVGSGTGFLSIHTGAYNTIVKNSYFENGGTGSSLLVLGKGGAYAYFDHNVFNITGSSGNILSANQFVGSGDSPEHVSYTNNVLYNNQPGSAFCYAMTVSGSGNLVENNTIYHNGSGILNQYGATSSGNVYRNNTLYGNTNFNPSANSLVENNKIYATTNIAANTIVSDNTFTTVAISGTGSVFANNTVSGTVTVKGNDNSIIENNITTTGDYAVDLGTTTGNNVTDNYLIANELKGDEAVKSSSETNIVENNFPAKVTINVTADPVTFGDDVIVKVTGSVDGDYTVTIGDVTKEVSLVAGEVAGVNFGALDAGSHNITASYAETVYYIAAVNDTEIAVVNKADVTIDVSAVDVTYGEEVIVEVTGSVDGDYTVTVNGVTENVTLVAGEAASVNFGVLDADTYSIVVNYAETMNYNAAVNDTESVTVRKISTEITADDVFVICNDTSGRLIVQLRDADGNPIAGAKVKITVGDLTKSMNTYASGKAFISTGSLDVGDYVATVTFAGDDYYAPANATANVAVRMGNALTADDVIVVYQDVSGRLIVQLNDADGNPISGAKIRLTVGNLTKSMNTYASGKAYIGTKNLDIGDYIATVTYAGDDYYAPASATANVAVRAATTLTADDVIVVYHDEAGRLIVQLNDADGNPIAGAKIRFALGNLTKVMDTWDNGKAYINTKYFDIGDYVATVWYEGDDYYAPASATAKVSVRAGTVLTADDVAVVYNDTSGRLVVELKDIDGNPIAGAKVKITVGNLTKTMNTYASGKAFISTGSLDLGDYVATVTYAGDDYYAPASTTANVAVKKTATVLTAADVVATQGDSSKLIAELKDTEGNPISGVKVKFTLGNLTKSMDTSAAGRAYINTRTLAPGNYTAVISYAGNEDYTPSSINANVLIQEA